MNEYSHLTLDELRRRLVADPQNAAALREWFYRTQHVSEQTAREAARAAS